MNRGLDDGWVYDLEPTHRAELAMVSERLADMEWVMERPDAMSRVQLLTLLRDLMRGESIRIPAGTEAVSCRWCQRTVYWVRSRAVPQYNELVSIDDGDCRPPTATRDGYGFDHQTDCPNLMARRIQELEAMGNNAAPEVAKAS